MSIGKRYFEITTKLAENNWKLSESACRELDHIFNSLSCFLYDKFRDFAILTPEDIKQEIWVLFLNAKERNAIPRCDLLKLYVGSRIKRNLIGKGIFSGSKVNKVLRIVDSGENITGRHSISSNDLDDISCDLIDELEIQQLKKNLKNKFEPVIVEAYFKKYYEGFSHNDLKMRFNYPVTYETMQINYFPRIKEEIKKHLKRG